MHHRRTILVVAISWLLYVLFYLCRVNYSVAFPHAVAELALDYYIMGFIAGLFFLPYSLGQVVSGFLIVVKNPWTPLLVGGILSGLVNVLFGYASNTTLFAVLWALNGCFQSTAWVSLVRTLAITFEGEGAGAYMGFFNTSWALGISITWIITGYFVSALGWRYGFIANGFIMMALSTTLVLALKKITKCNVAAFYRGEQVTMYILARDLTKHIKLLVSLLIAYFLSTGTRYVFVVYVPSYFYTVMDSPLVSTFAASIYPLTGAVGMVFYGFLLDNYRGVRKVKPLLLSIPLTVALLCVLPALTQYGAIYIVTIIATIGFITYGVDAHLITTLPSVLMSKRILPFSVGLINAAGQLGSFALSVLAGYLISLYGFSAAFLCCATGTALMAPPLLALLHTRREHRQSEQ